MRENILAALLLCLAVFGIIGVILTIYDKIAAKKLPRHRVPEAVLVMFGVLGGAIPMYITMQLIRHKTKKPKFSVGFPIIILLHLALAAVMIFVVK